jgi:ATP adenylyltransferase
MKHIWAPWRIKYILSEKGERCILCDKPKEGRDAENHILYRGDKNFIILNRYPYNVGHLMVVPYRHMANLEELTREESLEHIEMIAKGVTTLRTALAPGGFNIGINIGRVAGAGIEDHLHTHVVPRWEGDTNYMPIIADTNVLPQALVAAYEKLKQAL